MRAAPTILPAYNSMNAITLRFTTIVKLAARGRSTSRSGWEKESIQSRSRKPLSSNSRPKHVLPSSGSRIYGTGSPPIDMKSTAPIFMMQYYSMACAPPESSMTIGGEPVPYILDPEDGKTCFGRELLLKGFLDRLWMDSFSQPERDVDLPRAASLTIAVNRKGIAFMEL